MFFWRNRVRKITGVEPPTMVGRTPGRYGDVPAQVYVNLSPGAPGGYPLGIFAIWHPLDPGADNDAIVRLLDAVHPLASRDASYWFDDGSGMAALALAAWLVRDHGWTTADALSAVAPEPSLLTDAVRKRWFHT